MLDTCTANPKAYSIIASRKAAESFHGDKAHQILAAQPLAAFGAMKKYMFEKLANEKFNTQRGRVLLAAEGFKTAKEKRRSSFPWPTVGAISM